MNSFSKTPSSIRMGQLYAEHQGWLYAWLCKKMGNSHDAADLTHETFLRLLQQQENAVLYHQPTALLRTVAKNLAINFWRKKKIEQIYYETIAHSQAEYYPSAEEEYIAIQTLYSLNQAFHRLNEREKQVFKLSQIQGLKYAAIAEQLNVSLTTVKRDMKQVLFCCLAIMQDGS